MAKVKNQTLDTGDGHVVHWADHGHADDPAVLLVHGGSGHTFAPGFVQRFSDLNVRFIEMHQRGVGLSQPYGRTDANTVDANTRDIDHVRQHLDIASWSIFSWSYGAVLMTNYAFAHPQQCRSLISYAPFLGSQEDYDVLTEKQPAEAAVYFAAQKTDRADRIAQNFYDSATSGDFDQRFQGYCNAQRIWNPDLDPTALYQTKTRAEWDHILQARSISAHIYQELYGVKNRFLENKADVGGPLHMPATLIYGTADGWSGFNAYADHIFANKQIMHVPDARHDVHQPAVLAVLHDQFAKLAR